MESMSDTPLNPSELALLLAVDTPGAGAPEVEALRAVGVALRDATSGGVDVADDVMLSLALQGATSGGVDVADDVMLSLALQGATSGGVDVADDVMLSLALQGATSGGVDVADDVMQAIAPAAAPVVELRPAVAVESAMPRWASLGGVAAFAALAAAILFTFVVPPSGVAPTVLTAEVAPSIYVAAVNTAQVEDLSVADGAVVAVMQYEEGGPTVILVEDSEG